MYQGIKFDTNNTEKLREYASTLGSTLPDAADLHVTFAVSPKPDVAFSDSLIGRTVKVYVTGYDNDGLNEGFQVKIDNFNKYEKHYKSKNQPHITISCNKAAGGKSVNTGLLNFKPVKSLEVEGEFAVMGE